MDTVQDAISKNDVINTLIQSDRGFQYISNAYKAFTAEAEMIVSMSHVGYCIDNGLMESFFGILKAEWYHSGKYDTYEKLERDLIQYIHFYNERRLQEKFNSLTPIKYWRKAVA